LLVSQNALASSRQFLHEMDEAVECSSWSFHCVNSHNLPSSPNAHSERKSMDGNIARWASEDGSRHGWMLVCCEAMRL